jgi:hypothetical protein
MKRTFLTALAALLLFTSACSKDAEVTAFISELDAATNEIAAKIDAEPSAAGIENAQKAFDARKPELARKWDGIKNAVGLQVSNETRTKLEESVKNNMKALTQVSIKHMMKLAADKEASSKFQKLLADYSTTFQTAAK